METARFSLNSWSGQQPFEPNFLRAFAFEPPDLVKRCFGFDYRFLWNDALNPISRYLKEYFQIWNFKYFSWIFFKYWLLFNWVKNSLLKVRLSELVEIYFLRWSLVRYILTSNINVIWLCFLRGYEGMKFVRRYFFTCNYYTSIRCILYFC